MRLLVVDAVKPGAAPLRRSKPASSEARDGSQFHWPPEVPGSLQPLLAHGPRFGPRPSSIATAKRSKRFYPTAKWQVVFRNRKRPGF